MGCVLDVVSVDLKTIVSVGRFEFRALKSKLITRTRTPEPVFNETILPKSFVREISVRETFNYPN